MLIGIVSDTHDDVASAEEAIEALSALKVARILHAGDFHRPPTAKLFANCGIHVDAVFGNCDAERDRIAELIPGTCRGLREIAVSSRVVVMVHDLAALGQSDAEHVDIIFHGHTHVPEVRKRGRVLLVNPGECCGARTGARSYAVWDTDSMEARIVNF